MGVVVPVPRTADGTPRVAQQDLILGQVAFKEVAGATQAMNVDGRASGAITVIWNGTGASDTGGDWTRGGDSGPTETTDAAHSGTNGLDTGTMGNDHELHFTNSVDIDPEDFSEVSFWIQPKTFPGNGEIRVKWQTTTGSNKGGTVNAEDYVTDMDLDVWQKITIPMADFGINTSDDVGRLHFEFHQNPQRHYIDDIELKAGGGDGPFTYRVAAPDANIRYHLTMMVLVVAGASSGWDDSTFANITALENGLLVRHRRISTADILWSLNSKDNVDLFGRFHPQDDIEFANGTLLVGFMIKPGLASVVVTDDDVLEWVVRDDLSSLSVVRAYAHYGIEVVP